METITRDELGKRISGFGLGRKEGRMAVDAVFDEIAKALVAGDRVELRGFGVFAAVTTPPRTNVRNPRTGQLVTIPERRNTRFRFRPGKELRRVVNNV